MKIVLWCETELAESLCELLPDDMLVSCVIDDGSNHEKMIRTIPVVTFDEFCQKYLGEVEGAFVCFGNGTIRMEAVKKLQYYGITRIGFPKLHRAFDVSHDGIVWNEGKPYLSQVEIHIMDSCNLNCSGCTHFSNLWDKNLIYDFNQYLADLHILSRRVFFSTLFLLGGEPFLNPNLADYLYAARAILPNTEIVLVTNGLLIPQQSEEVLEALRRTEISVEVSVYPPTAKMLEKIEKTLSDHGVCMCIRAERPAFSAILGVRGNSNPYVTQRSCGNSFCRYVRNGKLYKCPVDALSHKYSETFDVPLPVSEGIDLYAEHFERMLPLLDAPVQLCRFCSEKPRIFMWSSTNHPTKRDWLADSLPE